MRQIKLQDETLEDVVEAFETVRWKFYEVEEAEEGGGLIRIEVPRGNRERIVVDLKYSKPEQLQKAREKLKAAGFRRQVIEMTPDW